MTASANAPFAASRMIVVGLVSIDEDLAGLTQPADADRRSGAVPPARYLSPGATRSLLGALAAKSPPGDRQASPLGHRLTPREREVVDRIREGLSNKQIATKLGIAIHTVKCHVHNILAKLELDNRVQVAVVGRRGANPGWGPGLMES